MNCQRCGTINGDSAKFCRNCGDMLIKRNIMAEYPDLKLMPTTIAKPKHSSSSTFALYLFRLFTIVMILTSIVVYIGGNLYNGFEYYHEWYSYVRDEWVGHWYLKDTALIFFWTAPLSVIFGIITLIIRNKRNVKLPKEIEYVSMNPRLRRYPFVVANNKFGVFDMVAKKQTVPCEYETLSWVKPGKILEATHSQKGFIRIDICNNELR